MIASADSRQLLPQTHLCGSGLGCWQESHRHLWHSGHRMEGLVVHSGASLLKDVVAGCLVTGGGGGGSRASLVGRCTLGGCGGGGVGGAPLNGVSTYSLAERSDCGLGATRDTGGGGRSGAKGAVIGGGALMIGALGLWGRGRDVGPPWLAMWPSDLAA